MQLVRLAGSTAGDFEGRVVFGRRCRRSGRRPCFRWRHKRRVRESGCVVYNSSTGAKLWSQMVGSRSDDVSYDVVADGAGNACVSGYTSAISLDGRAWVSWPGP